LLTILTLRLLYLLFYSLKKKKVISPIEYHQTKNLLIGLIFYIFASSDFLINYGVESYPFGFLFILIFLGITAYAIVKHYLFGIKVILTELLVGVMGVVLLIQTFITETIRMKIFGFGVFILFCFIGYLLIKATHREIKAKEILEDKVKERTKELQTAYEDIKKRKEDLEKFYKLTVGRELRMIELKKEIKELEEKIKKE